MKNVIQITILTAISILVLVGVILVILNVLDIYTVEEAISNFVKSLYIVLSVTVGFSIISFVVSLFKK